ncbi:MAG: thioredoxin, partial [Betaproteobacteria bacterium]|nr:thioredoxin [Betaproteobacteria bacterium]
MVPHPFGTRSRDELHQIAGQCVDEIARLLCEPGPGDSAAARGNAPAAPRAVLIEAPADLDELNKLYIKRRWGDGLLIAPPTQQAVERMLLHTRRAPGEVVATIAPGFGADTVEYIAINAVMAGCYPEYLPLLIAAAEAVATPKFHVQAIQATTNPAAVWLIVNGPIARRLEVNGGSNCLGQGTWANATLGRALRL